MQPSSKISAYLKSVCDQIRWKKAHSTISKEIEDHIIDQINAHKAAGMDEETAVDLAIREMGDPVLVGTQFDRTYRPKMEWSILILTGLLLMAGLAVRVLISDLSISRYGNQHFLFMRQIIHTIIGVGCMLATYFIDFTIIGKYPRALFFGLATLTIGVMFASPTLNGIKYYAKFLVLLFPVVFAGMIYWFRNRGYLGILLCGIVFAGLWLLGWIVPTVSGVIAYSIACLFLITYAIIKGWFNVNRALALLMVYGSTAVLAIIFFLIAIAGDSYRLERLMVMIDPSIDPQGMGYVTLMTRELLSNAQFFGQGNPGRLGDYALPGADTDLMLTTIIHRFGWIAFIIIMAILLVFILRAFALCLKQKSILARLVSVSVLITLTLEIAGYVSFNLGFQPVSPLSLPLISYGGMATLINMFLIGLMLSVFKSDRLVRDPLISQVQMKHKFIEIAEGKIIIHYK